MTAEPVFPSMPPAFQTLHRTVAFTSGKGGVGKSNLVLATGLALARRGKRVVLLDGDLGLASINVLLGQSPRYDLRHVLAGERALREIVLRGPHGLTIIPAGSGLAELAALPQEERGRLLQEIAPLAHEADFLLIDTGAGIGDTVLDLIAAADEAIVVTRPEPTALADAYALMKVVIQQEPAFPFHVLVNMARDAEQGRQVFVSLEQILVRFLGYQPGDAGCVLHDAAVGRAVVKQVPFSILEPRCGAARGVETLAERLVGRRATSAARGGFWARLGLWRSVA
ncbi:MAG TPA: MinD/ParA family protein [Terriglobales bacterium]|nr:MinD/ParA family protein [Terriglobales bacterium]